MAERKYYALVYSTLTGAVQNELPLWTDPEWAQQIDLLGSWKVQTPIGQVRLEDGTQVNGLGRDRLMQIVSQGRFSVAVCYGDGSANDPVLQGGPIWTYDVDEGNDTVPPSITLGGSGFWGVLAARLQVPGTWTPAVGFATAASVATYTSSLQGIASLMLTDTVTRGSLPLDIPTPISGSNTRTYNGFDMISVGQRLQELTQVNNGPDVLFQPYFSTPNVIRTKALIGNPTLAQAGDPLVFDYGSNLASVKVSSAGSKLCTTQFEKGNGVTTGLIWSFAQDATLLGAGWPLLETVDSTHSDVTVQADLDSYATANLALNGRPIETWAAVVRADMVPLLGTYNAGFYATYRMQSHPWLRDGQYANQRILGLQQGSRPGDVVHILQSMQGVF